MSGERIDVLEVLRVHGGLDDVAAAVAELIEAATAVMKSPRRGGSIEARQNLAAALARVGGA